VFAAPTAMVEVFVVDATDGSVARDLTQALRVAGLSADRAFDGRSMKSQMKAADRSGARLACIVGEQEQSDGTVTVRDLRSDRAQEVVARADLITHLQKILTDEEATR
jgi:histidyl-tRNA synthetase